MSAFQRVLCRIDPCSERQLPALHVEMCMAQHLSVRGFLAFTAIGTNVRTSLIPPPPQKKNQSPYPRPTTREGKPDGGMFGAHNASSVGSGPIKCLDAGLSS